MNTSIWTPSAAVAWINRYLVSANMSVEFLVKQCLEIFSSLKLLLNAGSVLICTFTNYVLTNLTNAIFCDKREHKGTMRWTEQESRKEDITQKVDLTVRQVTESIATSKENMKQNENSQKNLQERVPKTSRKKRQRREQHPELVSAIVNELKPELNWTVLNNRRREIFFGKK